MTQMHEIPSYTGPFIKAFSSLKHRWDANRQSIETAQTSMLFDITGKTLTHLIVALPEPFRSRALNKGTRTWTNLRMLGEGKEEMFVKPSKFRSGSSKHQLQNAIINVSEEEEEMQR